MPAPLQIGLVGAGRRGRRLAQALAAAGAPGVLVGVTDADPERAAALAAATGAAVYTSTAALLAAADVVLVAIPPPDAGLVARTALAEGTPVFLAWPPTAGPAEAEALVAAAEEAGVEAGASRPLPAAPLLAVRPAGWAARLIALDLATHPDAGDDGDDDASDPLAGRPWPHRLAGALDLCAALARSRDVLRVEAEAERGPGRTLRAVAFTLRFRNGAYAQAAVTEAVAPLTPSARFRLFATGGGVRVEARGWDGPLCVDGSFSTSSPGSETRDPLPAGADPETTAAAREALDFLTAVAAGRPAPFSVHDALDTLRLTERLMERLR